MQQEHNYIAASFSSVLCPRTTLPASYAVIRYGKSFGCHLDRLPFHLCILNLQLLWTETPRLVPKSGIWPLAVVQGCYLSLVGPLRAKGSTCFSQITTVTGAWKLASEKGNLAACPSQPFLSYVIPSSDIVCKFPLVVA